ncbi:MAG: Holliday junction resolvase RuvX [Oscillospiraceae bacterium]
MKIMAVDYGEARTGLAVCDKTEFLASPIGTIEEKNFMKAANMVAYTAKQYEVGKIVVGHPKNMDGSEGQKATKCADFADLIEQMSGIETVLWDERCTTVLAHNYLSENDVRGKKRKEMVDQVAAVIILESYLQSRKNQK